VSQGSKGQEDKNQTEQQAKRAANHADSFPEETALRPHWGRTEGAKRVHGDRSPFSRPYKTSRAGVANFLGGHDLENFLLARLQQIPCQVNTG
jgi:hypothetical protein